MVVFDDWDGFYFSIQALRMYHSECMKNIEFVIINSNPTSKQGKEVAKFVKDGFIKEPVHYYEDDNSLGAFTKGKIFDYAKTPYVLTMDCHVLLKQGAIKELIGFFDAGLDKGGLVHGPLIHDDMKTLSTHLKRTWGSGMLGQWDHDPRVETENYFEIPAQGMGVFACRKDSWLGFNKQMNKFGGEEYFIHDKFKASGKRTICLSSLKWMHRFRRPNGVPYPIDQESKFKNQVRGFLELDKPVFEVIEHFKSIGTAEKNLRKWLSDVTKENAQLY